MVTSTCIFAKFRGGKGFLTAFSYIAIPSLLAIPNLPERTLLSVWKQLYYRGFTLSPPLSVFSSCCCFINAYLASKHHSSNSSPVARLLLAGTLMFGILPYTALIVAPGNRKMMTRWRELVDENGRVRGGEERKEGGGVESRERVRRWGRLNYGRVVLPLAGAFVAWTTAW